MRYICGHLSEVMIYVRNSLFGAVILVKIADIDKYKYSGYSIGFDTHVPFSLCNGSGFGKSGIIFLSQHAIFREDSLSVPLALQCSGHPGNILKEKTF